MITQLVVCNASRIDIKVYLVLGATPGCLNDVSQVPFVTDGSGLVGSFTLKAKKSTRAWAPDGLGFNGSLAFGSMPLNCPSDAMPFGVNVFEFIINNGFQEGKPQETVDISCVAGVNSIIRAELGGPTWNAGPTQPKVVLIQNGVPPTNTGKVGVFPYGCDNCTEVTAPPECADHPWPYETPQTDKICNVQRDAKSTCGGVVKVSYIGPASYPA